MAGFNGVRRTETSDRSSNQMLQDVAVGWLQKYRNEAPARVMSKVTEDVYKRQIQRHSWPYQ